MQPTNTDTLRRPITSTDLCRKKFNVLNFTGQWLAFVGRPEVKGSWLIYGDSSHGKTRFMLQLAKYLGSFGRVFINSLEEGESESIKQGFIAEEIDSKQHQVYLLDREPLPVLRQYLTRRNAPQFVFIDSVQFMRAFTEADYNSLLDDFRNKLFIFTSHAEGKRPKGALADAIRYNSFVKIRVEGYRAFPKSRFGGGQPFDIWPEGAENYWVNKN